MSVTVEVGLLSGRTAALQVALDEEVDELTRRIQTVFGVGKGRPLDSSGHVLETLTPVLLLPFLAMDLS